MNYRNSYESEKSKDYDDFKNDNIMHDEAQNPCKTGVHQSPIRDE